MRGGRQTLASRKVRVDAPYDIVPGRPWPEHLVSMLNPARNTP